MSKRSRGIGIPMGLALALFAVACDGGPSVSDAALTEDVTARLERDREIGPQDVQVTTRDGVVTLTGRVASEDQRYAAARIAREAAGVRDVVNHIEAEKAAGAARAPGDVGAPGANVPAPPNPNPDPS
jgi:hypothetical protein